jgi:hypothetical protein
MLTAGNIGVQYNSPFSNAIQYLPAACPSVMAVTAIHNYGVEPLPDIDERARFPVGSYTNYGYAKMLTTRLKTMAAPGS